MTADHSDQVSDLDPCTTLHLPFELSSAGVARRTLAEQLTRVGLRETFVGDAQLVLSELVANGLEHGEPNADGVIEVSWCIADDVVRISVCDGGTPATLRVPEFSDSSQRGRGLQIVDHLCAAWEVESDPGLRVTAELRFEDALSNNP
ncbi:MAG: ATP-binding protein [Aeromicrobium sp.]